MLKRLLLFVLGWHGMRWLVTTWLVMLGACGAPVEERPSKPTPVPRSQTLQPPAQAVDMSDARLPEDDEEMEARGWFGCDKNNCEFRCASGAYCCGPCEVCNAKLCERPIPSDPQGPPTPGS